MLLTLYSLPDFWAALMISLLFGIWWHVLPPNYMVDPSLHDYMGPWDAFVDRVQHLILPVATLTLLTMAAIARYQRSAMLEVLPAEYIRTARAKGSVGTRDRLASRLPQCAHANGRAVRDFCSRRCWAARCSSRKFSHGREWAFLRRRPSADATMISSRQR